MASTPSLRLSPASGSFSFQPKQIKLRDQRVALGIEIPNDPAHTSSSSNGLFAVVRTGSSTGISPLPVSTSHAEVWLSGSKVYIRDLDSPFGTFVNGAKITTATLLRQGDILSLGSPVQRNSQTPAYITDDHLKPIIAKVVLAIGLSGW
ncbi:hypothetical protein K443DRAFT_175824 [Laccaria amethystina LaAM-08-1]|uniref:FHA domain-containing protein n=1 Tax=Laccaria amethystina LaAM-08-1 TaxID=1095629 RepID=A0A0C9XP39_9AGAR|nr:hypothetical protein K443DRAFT_175824 [Laccaria amethystina LaAM-08-1]